MQPTQTPTEHAELLNTQSSVETNNNKNYPLLTREQLQYTPFWIVGSDETGYTLTWGKFRFNDEPLKTQDDVREWYMNHHWDITLHLIAIAIASLENERKSEHERK